MPVAEPERGAAGAMPAAAEAAAEMETSGDARWRFRGDSVMGERGILSGFRSNEFLRL